MGKVDKLIMMIGKLKTDELLEFTKRLKELGLPPAELVGVPAQPKPTPPTLTDAIGMDFNGEPLIKRKIK